MIENELKVKVWVPFLKIEAHRLSSTRESIQSLPVLTFRGVFNSELDGMKKKRKSSKYIGYRSRLTCLGNTVFHGR